ncbi:MULTISPECIES: hypothetical protein [Bacillus cereus group]|uniref:hypothetical protein n=1 Tax=Bacillus cereus group TaxID=86661 RepID=UPI000BEC0AB2|nr:MULTISPECIES: hypothetical protein [Bacillus cereus group]MEC3335012.1 hypothetical protein [Bacillus cereus]PDX93018.1 hypothetical protein COM78_20460 [Bacillus thuringiensis]PEX85747.1 hypothetical protein CN450_16675 [Bacillus cereus]
MNKLLSGIANNSVFVVCSGIASLVSLVVAFTNDNLVLWTIFTCCIFIALLMINLVLQNQKMFKRLDDLKYDIFNQNIDLEFDEEKDFYFLNSPIIIVLTSFLTVETLNKNPFVMVQVEYPSELDIEFNIMSENIYKDEANSNSAKFKVVLKSEAIVLVMENIRLKKDRENEFLRTTQKINITFESELFSENKKESLLVTM